MVKTALVAVSVLLELIGAAAAADPQPAIPDVPTIFDPAQREGYFFVGEKGRHFAHHQR